MRSPTGSPYSTESISPAGFIGICFSLAPHVNVLGLKKPGGSGCELHVLGAYTPVKVGTMTFTVGSLTVLLLLLNNAGPEILQPACRPEPGKPYCNILWSNKAATERYGPMLSQKQRVEVVEGYPTAIVDSCKALMKNLYEHVLVRMLFRCCFSVDGQKTPGMSHMQCQTARAFLSQRIISNVHLRCRRRGPQQLCWSKHSWTS